MIEVLWYGVLGALLGSLGGLFGIGGGLIAIPVLGVLFGMDQQLAQGTALVMVVPNVMLALWRYNQRNRVDWRLAASMAGASLLCAWLASLWAVGVDAGHMRKGFVVFLVGLVAFNLWQMRSGAARPGAVHSMTTSRLALLGGVSGAMGGLFAVGGAVVATPVLTGVFGASQVVAQGLALSLALPSTLVTLLTYAWHGHVLWSMGLPLAVGGLVSVSWGVRLAHTLPERQLRVAFCGFLLVCAVILAFKS